MVEWNHYFSQWTQTKKKPDTCCSYSGLIISLGRESVTAGSICPSFFLSLSVSLRISHTCGTQTTVKQINSRKAQKAVWAQLDKSHKHYDHRVKDNCRHVEIVWKGLTEGIHILFLSLAGGFDGHSICLWIKESLFEHSLIQTAGPYTSSTFNLRTGSPLQQKHHLICYWHRHCGAHLRGWWVCLSGWGGATDCMV